MVLLILFFNPYLYQEKLPSVFPNHATLSAVKVTTASHHI